MQPSPQTHASPDTQAQPETQQAFTAHCGPHPHASPATQAQLTHWQSEHEQPAEGTAPSPANASKPAMGSTRATTTRRTYRMVNIQINGVMSERILTRIRAAKESPRPNPINPARRRATAGGSRAASPARSGPDQKWLPRAATQHGQPEKAGQSACVRHPRACAAEQPAPRSPTLGTGTAVRTRSSHQPAGSSNRAAADSPLAAPFRAANLPGRRPSSRHPARQPPPPSTFAAAGIHRPRHSRTDSPSQRSTARRPWSRQAPHRGPIVDSRHA